MPKTPTLSWGICQCLDTDLCCSHANKLDRCTHGSFGIDHRTLALAELYTSAAMSRVEVPKPNVADDWRLLVSCRPRELVVEYLGPGPDVALAKLRLALPKLREAAVGLVESICRPTELLELYCPGPGRLAVLVQIAEADLRDLTGWSLPMNGFAVSFPALREERPRLVAT